MYRRNIALILLFDSKKKILLQHRTPDAENYPNFWGFFGGEINPDETPIQAVFREAWEELRYKLNNPTLVLIQKFKGEYNQGTKHIFMEKIDPSQKLDLNEGQSMGWFTLLEAKSLKMNEHDKEVVELLTPKF